MNLKKLLATLLALMLALIPMTAMAADGQGSFTLTLSDPQITLQQGDSPITQDFTGVGLQLGGVMTSGSEALLSLAVLAQGQQAASALALVSGNEVQLLINGLSSALTLTTEEALKVAEQAGVGIPQAGAIPSLPDIAANMATPVAGLTFTEGPAEQVQFYSKTGSYPRHSLSLSNEQLKLLLKDVPQDVQLPENMTCDISYFTDGGENVRVEGTLNNVVEAADADERNLDFLALAETKDDGEVNVDGHIGNKTGNISFKFNGAPDDQYEGHYSLEGAVDVTSKSSADDTYQLQVSYGPGEAEDGTVYDMLGVTALAGETPLGSLNAVSYNDGQSEGYSLYVGDASEQNYVGLAYDGAIKTSGTSRVHEGTLQFGFSDGQVETSGSVKTSLDISDDVAGKMPDFSSMPKIEVSKMTAEQQQQLMTELQAVGITAMGSLMTIPSVAAILSSMMGGMM